MFLAREPTSRESAWQSLNPKFEAALLEYLEEGGDQVIR